MSKSTYTIELDEADRSAALMMEVLKNDVRFRVQVEKPPQLERDNFECGVCGESHPFSNRRTLPEPTLPAFVCPLCQRAGNALLEQARSAAHEHWRAVMARMPEFIRRKRSGDPDPVFYAEAGE